MNLKPNTPILQHSILLDEEYCLVSTVSAARNSLLRRICNQSTPSWAVSLGTVLIAEESNA